MKCSEKKSSCLTAATRKRIFAALKKRGLVGDDERRDIQFDIIGKRSLKEFTEQDGRQLLGHLLGKTGDTKKNHVPYRKYVRKKWIEPEGPNAGMIHLYVTPTSTQPQIRKCYALLKQIQPLEAECYERGLLERPENHTPSVTKRLDGWARNMTNGHAEQLGELMYWEAHDLIEVLKQRLAFVRRRRVAGDPESGPTKKGEQA